MTLQLVLTLEELWAVFHFCRFPASAPDYGREYSKELMGDVFHGILLCEANRDATYSLWLSEDNLWEITRTVPKDYAVGLMPVGRALLVKAFLLLNEAATEVAFDDYSASTEASAEARDGIASADVGADPSA